MDKKDKIQVCKVIAQAIMADAQITDTERAFLEKLMDGYDLSPAERKDVMKRNVDDDPARMAEEISGIESRDDLLGELLEVVAVDGEVAPAEAELVRKVGLALGMSDEEISLVMEE